MDVGSRRWGTGVEWSDLLEAPTGIAGAAMTLDLWDECRAPSNAGHLCVRGLAWRVDDRRGTRLSVQKGDATLALMRYRF
jgi:hypothetical protein